MASYYNFSRIFWDKKEADRLYHAYVDLGVELKKDLDSELGEININSPKQLSNRLFNELGLPTKDIEKREKTGNWATDSKNLMKSEGKNIFFTGVVTIRLMD